MTAIWSDLDWGTVPAWTGSILTSGSIFVAALAYRRNLKDKEADQATNIYAWTDRLRGDGERRLRVRNGSQSIVYSIEARAFGAPLIEIPELPPKTEFHSRVPAVDQRQLSGTFKLRYPIPIISATGSLEIQKCEPFPLLRFRDAAGRWWQRDGRGRLKPVRRGPTPTRSTLSIDTLGINLVELVWDYETGTIAIGRRKRSKQA